MKSNLEAPKKARSRYDLAICVVTLLTAASAFHILRGQGEKRLDGEILSRLDLSGSVQLQPGESSKFQVGSWELQSFKPVKAQVVWSIQPSRDANIDQSGLLRIDATARAGTTFEVSASVEGGRRVLRKTVHIYTPESNPLVGLWRQSRWKLCTPVPELPASSMDPPVEELEFRADGSFSVTWKPFEWYRDYWGRYSYDLQSGSIELRIEHGNFVPNDFAGKGGFKIHEGQLTLKRVWLGTKEAKQKPDICELTFVRK